LIEPGCVRCMSLYSAGAAGRTGPIGMHR
jgi:hypothetical protein